MRRIRGAACLVLVGAIASSCQLPVPGKTDKPSLRRPAVYKGTQSKVKVMTDTFSLAKNAGLKKAATSLSEVSASLSAAFAQLSGQTGPGQVGEGLQQLRVLSLREMYKVAGTTTQGDATLVYDDETREVTGIKGKDAEVAFKFAGTGKTRSWEATILKSPDGTTGSLSIEATGSWKAMPPSAPREFKFMNDEAPEFVDEVSFKLKLVPKGDASLAIELSGKLDDPEALPGSTMRAPTHWVIAARVPKIRFDWDSDLDLASGANRFTAAGRMTVEVGADAEETFEYDLAFDEAKRSGAFGLTNVGAKVKLSVTGTQAAGAQPDVEAVLLSTETGEQLGTVEPNPQRPGHVTVKLASGETLDWEVVPKELQAMPGPVMIGPPPVEPPPFEAPEPSFDEPPLEEPEPPTEEPDAEASAESEA